MKRLWIFLTISALGAILAFSASASTGTVTRELSYAEIRILLDGAELIPTYVNGNYVEPFIIDGTTYLPVRGIASALELEVDWDDANKTVLLTASEKKRPAELTLYRLPLR